jgi:hypothetical protein
MTSPIATHSNGSSAIEMAATTIEPTIAALTRPISV